jgi:hypothetical protein
VSAPASSDDLETTSARAARGAPPRGLPTWPLAAYFLGLPVWWVLGLIDVIMVPIGAIMALYLVRARIRVPRGFALWAVFLFFMGASIIELTRYTQYLTFSYRAGIYLSSTVLFLYIYNSWRTISDRRILGYLVGYFVVVVAGGYLGAAYPSHSFKTPAFEVLDRLSPFLSNNPLVRVMVVRPFSQYDPTNFYQIPPRPAAPFLYTNNWGNVYSLLLPVVVLFLLQTRRHTPLRTVLFLLVLASTVPATLTLNRGMFIGLAIVAMFVGLRLAARGHVGRVLAAATLAGAIGVFLWNTFNVSAGLETRTQASTETRSRLYEQSLHQIGLSPIFGFGVTIDASTNPYDPKVGTQGQFWMVMVSHGVIAVACFIGFFLVTVLLSLPRRDLASMVYSAIIVAATVETIYYGQIPYGLPIVMTTAALAHRPRPRAPTEAAGRQAGTGRRTVAPT